MLLNFHTLYICFSKRREFDSCHVIFLLFLALFFYAFFDNTSESTQNVDFILHMLLMGNQAIMNTEVVSKLTKMSSSMAASRVVCKDKAMMFPVQSAFSGVLHSIKSWGTQVTEY